MSNTRKTALLQRFAGALVEERAQERAQRLGGAAGPGGALQRPSESA